jgi:hypothetical protein
MAYSSLAQLHMLGWRHDVAIEPGSRAIALAREIGDDEALSHALNNVGAAWLNSGERTQGQAMLKEAFARAADADSHDHAARALVNLTYGAAAAEGIGEAEPSSSALAYAREH